MNKLLVAMLHKLCGKFFLCQKIIAKSRFKSMTKVYLSEFIFDLNLEVQNSMNQKAESRIAFYGGFNNLFFVEHFLGGKLRLITKVASAELTLRESVFFNWQKKINPMDRIAPEMLLYKKLEEGNVSCLTMECLSLPKEYRPAEIIDLYKRMGGLSEYLPTFPGVRANKEILQFEFEAETKITNIIKNIATQLHHSHAYAAAADFMDARLDIFANNMFEFKEIKRFLLDSEFIKQHFDYQKHYGFLHGDFKKNNILSDKNGVLKVVDMQYYNFGARLWDMAFFCSKEKGGFEECYVKIILPLELDNIELRIFVFFYILAVLLHVKKSNLKKVLRLKTFPAIYSLNIRQTLTR